jgi:two-component system, cell cycle response regulator DivK
VGDVERVHRLYEGKVFTIPITRRTSGTVVALRPRTGAAIEIVRPQALALVIDDSDDTREVYAFALRLEGFTVEQAGNGHEGVEKAVELLPDIIITDLSMPVMDGWETIRRLRSDERTRRIPIIACSGYDDAISPDATGARAAAADAILPKPCPFDRLMLNVRRLLRRDAVA